MSILFHFASFRRCLGSLFIDCFEKWTRNVGIKRGKDGTTVCHVLAEESFIHGIGDVVVSSDVSKTSGLCVGITSIEKILDVRRHLRHESDGQIRQDASIVNEELRKPSSMIV